MAYPPVIVVDEHDQEIGLEMLAVVWQKGLYHRVARIMVEDASGRVLLQRRSDNMKLYPGRWDNSAAGHVDEGMGYDSAASQEVAEELGLSNVILREMGYYFAKDSFEDRKMYNFSKVYLVTLDSERPDITLEPEEVSEVRWVSRAELQDLVLGYPDEITDGLRQVAKRYY
jgi:isopentenyl-diphosphate delta-isomerase